MPEVKTPELPGLDEWGHQQLALVWREKNQHAVIDWITTSIESLYWTHDEMQGKIARLDRRTYCMMLLEIGTAVGALMMAGDDVRAMISSVLHLMRKRNFA